MVPSYGNWGLGKEQGQGKGPACCRGTVPSLPLLPASAIFSHRHLSTLPTDLVHSLRGSLPLCPFARHSDIHSPGLAHRLGLSVPLRRQSGPEFPGQGRTVPESSEEAWWVDTWEEALGR